MERLNPDRSPTALFVALEVALRREDARNADHLRSRLKRLGVKVTVDAKKFRRVVIGGAK